MRMKWAEMKLRFEGKLEAVEVDTAVASKFIEEEWDVVEFIESMGMLDVDDDGKCD